MSANTKSQLAIGKPITGGRIRAGALSLPLSFALKTHANSARELKRELSNINIPGNPEQFISAGAYLDALSRIDHFSNHTAEILHAALSQDIGDLGLLGKAIVHSENVWEALQTTREGMRYFQPGSDFEVRLHQGKCRLLYCHTFGDGPGPTLDTQYSIGVLGNLLMNSVDFGSANASIRYPGAHARHEALFGNVAEISASEYGIIEFDDKFLKSPLRRSKPNVVEIVRDAMQSIPDNFDQETEYSTLVSVLQSSSIRLQAAPLQQTEVSALLDISSRMLQYRLKQEGVRFDHLRDRERHLVAREALLLGKSTSEVANEVGFVHRQGFSEAFSRWEGITPSEFRSRGRLV